MRMFINPPKIYLHKQPVDFRKSINGLSLLVEQDCSSRPLTVPCLYSAIGSAPV